MIQIDYADLVAVHQGKKLQEMIWGCSCSLTKKQLDQGNNKIYPTSVTPEGVCIKCGYYAFRIEKRVLGMKKQQLRREIMDQKIRRRK